MKTLTLNTNDLFLRYGGSENVLVLKLKAQHSSLVKEVDWEYLYTVGSGNQYTYQSLTIFDCEIKGDYLKNLASDLLQSRLLINREGYCYLESEIISSSIAQTLSRTGFSHVEYYRINDLFRWSEYKVVKSEITTAWDRCDLKNGNLVIIPAGSSNIRAATTNNNVVPSNNYGSNGSYNNNNNTASLNLKDYYEKRLTDIQVEMEETKRKLDAKEKENAALRANKATSSASSSQSTSSPIDTTDVSSSPPIPDQSGSSVAATTNATSVSSQQTTSSPIPVQSSPTVPVQSSPRSVSQMSNIIPFVPPPPPPPLPPPSYITRAGRYHFEVEETSQIHKSSQKLKPGNFLFQVRSYKTLKRTLEEANCDEFESPEFDVEGYKWVLSIYLRGHPDDNVDSNGYISMYLKMRPDSTRRIENVKLLVRFFIYNYRFKEYVTIQDMEVKEFDDRMNMEVGVAQAISIDDFENLNGFVRGDRCRFGVEVLMVKNSPYTAALSLYDKLERRLGRCDFAEYSKLPNGGPSYSKNQFKIDIYTWKVQIYPKGRGKMEDDSLSVFLELVDIGKVSNGEHLFVDFELRLKDKRSLGSGGYYPKRRVAWFTQSDYNHGFEDYIPLAQLTSSVTSFILGDCVTIEVYFNDLFKLKTL